MGKWGKMGGKNGKNKWKKREGKMAENGKKQRFEMLHTYMIIVMKLITSST